MYSQSKKDFSPTGEGVIYHQSEKENYIEKILNEIKLELILIKEKIIEIGNKIK